MSYEIEICCASVFTLFCIVATFIYRYTCNIYNYFDKQDIRGPRPTLLLGTWKGYKTKFLGDEDSKNTLEYGKIFGTFDGLTPNLLVTDPDVIKIVLLTSAGNFQDRRAASSRDPTLRKSLSSLAGEEEREVQTLISSSFSEDKIKTLLPRVQSSVDSLLHNISKVDQVNERLSLTSIINDFIHDVTALTLFGIDLNADIEFKEEYVKFSEQILTPKISNSFLALIPFLYERLQGDSWVLPQNAVKYFTHIIKSSIKATPKSAEAGSESKSATLIDLLLEAAEEEKKLVKKDKEGDEVGVVLTEEVIISKCIASLLNLSNATRTTVFSSIYALAQNADVQEKLFKEIQKNQSETVSYEDLQNTPYLDMVLGELLRLYPSEFRLEKVCRETLSIGKIRVDKGVRVSVPLFALHNCQEFYNEPEKFNPERFSNEASQKRNAYTYLPFGQSGLNGSNISHQVGLLAAKVAVYKLVEKLQFRQDEASKELNFFRTGITGVPRPQNIDGVIVQPRNAHSV